LNQLGDKTIGTLVTEDVNSSIQYAGCQQKHSAVVSLYEEWRQKMIDYVASLRAAEEER